MMLVLTEKQNYEDIAGAIRAKLGTQTTYKPGEMAAAIASIQSRAPRSDELIIFNVVATVSFIVTAEQFTE